MSELTETLEEVETAIRRYSEELIQALALRDELDYEKEVPRARDLERVEQSEASRAKRRRRQRVAFACCDLHSRKVKVSIWVRVARTDCSAGWGDRGQRPARSSTSLI